LPEGREARVAPVGELIRAQRRRRGLSQAALAGLLGRSEGWLSKVERGEIEVDRISVLLQIAEVLRVPASTLMPGTLPELSDVEHSAALHLRLALSGHDILVAMFADPAQRVIPSRPREDLDAELATCWRLVHGPSTSSWANGCRSSSLLLSSPPEIRPVARAASSLWPRSTR
jgi:transcriptional regulator with XRE-family HTH domain